MLLFPYKGEALQAQSNLLLEVEHVCRPQVVALLEPLFGGKR